MLNLISVRLGYDFLLLWTVNPELPSAPDSKCDRASHVRETKLSCGIEGVSRFGPAHKRIDFRPAFGLKLDQPVAGVETPRLKNGTASLADANADFLIHRSTILPGFNFEQLKAERIEAEGAGVSMRGAGEAVSGPPCGPTPGRGGKVQA